MGKRSKNILLITILLFMAAITPLTGISQSDTVTPEKDTGVYDVVYRYDGTYRKTDLVLMSIASGLTIVAHYSDPGPLSETEVMALDPMDITSFDRPAISNVNAAASTWSDYILAGSFAVPAVVSLLAPKTADDRFNAAFLTIETMLLTNSMNVFSKVIFSRKRPYVYNPEVSMGKRTSPDALASFYSGHTANVAAMSFLSAKLLNDYFPENSFVDFVVWPVAAILPAVQGYLRVEGGQHFPTDVILGYALGALTGFAVPWLHHEERYNNGKLKLGITPTIDPYGGTGVSLGLRF